MTTIPIDLNPSDTSTNKAPEQPAQPTQMQEIQLAEILKCGTRTVLKMLDVDSPPITKDTSLQDMASFFESAVEKAEQSMKHNFIADQCAAIALMKIWKDKKFNQSMVDLKTTLTEMSEWEQK